MTNLALAWLEKAEVDRLVEARRMPILQTMWALSRPRRGMR